MDIISLLKVSLSVLHLYLYIIMARLLVKRSYDINSSTQFCLDYYSWYHKKEDQLQLIMSVNIHFVTTFSSFLLYLTSSTPTILFQLSQLYVLLLFEARVNGHLFNTILKRCNLFFIRESIIVLVSCTPETR